MSRNYQDPLYKKWRQQIYKRDNFTCQWPHCGKTKKLNAHHIQRWADFPGLRYHINNGITLCRDCHQRIKDNEENYSAFFNSIILNKLRK
jgi:5-methylcytosine-specific restriction endonuclease McrA